MVVVGLDVGRSEHQFEVLDQAKRSLDKGKVPNASWALEAWCAHIETLGTEVSIALEGSNGLATPLDQFVATRGWRVIPIPPDALHSYRQHVLRVNDKTDVTDARALGLLAIEGGSRYIPRSQPRRHLRELSRWRDTMVKERTRTMNRLRKTVCAYWPDVTQGGLKFTSDYVGRLFEGIPDPTRIAELGLEGLTEFFRGQQCKVRKSSLHGILELASRAQVTAQEKPILVKEARVLARRLRHLHEDIQDAEELIADLTKNDSQVQALEELTGVGLVLAAQFMAEVQDIADFRKEASLASYGGLALRRLQTGKSRNTRVPQVKANRHLKRCLMQMANTRRLHHPQSTAYYEKKVSEGKTHLRALRCLARQLLRTLYGVLTST